MSDVFITVVSGVTVFVLGQIFIKFFIEPIHDLKHLIGEIADNLIFYANVPAGGRLDVVEKPSEAFRQLSSRLIAKKHMIPLYKLWEKLGVVPKTEHILNAHSALIGISNGLLDSQDPPYVKICRKKVEQALNLDTGQR